MELIKEEKKFWETVIKGSDRVNAEGDIIVPDVKPDVLKVLQIDAKSVITEKGIVQGGIYAKGKVHVNILYLTDGAEEETGCIKTVLDFRIKTDNGQITNDMKLKIESDVSKIDFVLLNSRKLSIKSTISVDYEIIAEKTVEIPTEFDEEGFECIKKCVEADTIGSDEEFSFSVRGSLEVSSGKPSVKEMIKTDIKLLDYESKIVSSKIIVNGTLGVCVLYFTDDMSIDFCEGEIPFTEVFGVEDILEDDDCEIGFRIGNIDVDLSQDSDGDIRIIDVECVTEFDIRANRREKIEYISDCYCPGKDTECMCDDVKVNGYIDFIVKETNERNVVTYDENIPEISRVYNIVAEPEITKCTVQNGGVNVCGRVKMYILYLTPNSKCPVYSLKKDLPFEYYHQSEGAKEGMECSGNVSLSHLMYNLNSKGEIEVKYSLKQQVRITQVLELKLICDAKTQEIGEENDIIIYFVKKEDSLWGIGKKYGVKVSDIMEINKLEDDEIMVGQKLLIPIG